MSVEHATRPAWADVDLDAITHNLDLVRQRAGRPVRLIVPVKANAYGHGVVEVGRHLESIGVDGLATANFDEAVELRDHGVRLPIVMYASQLPHGIDRLLDHALTPTIADRGALAAATMAAAGRAGPVGVHVEVDAGFGRLGVRFDEVPGLVAELIAQPGLRLEGLYTHVPFGDAEGAVWARRRVAAFGALVQEIEARHGIRIPYTQVAASAALIEQIPDDVTTVAPGHLAYGISPLNGIDVESLGFRRALVALRASVIHIGSRSADDDLAPGLSSEPMRTAVLLLGIDNGYAYGEGSSVLLGGRRCPVLSVTAEYTVIDVTQAGNVNVGDTATVIGAANDDVITLGEVATQQRRSPAYWMMGLCKVQLRHGR